MASDPIYEVATDSFTAKFMLGADDDIATVEDVDAVITLPDGSRWSASFLTLPEIDRIMKRWESSGECGHGAYFTVNDLVIVRKGGIPAMVSAVAVGLAEDGASGFLTRLPE